LIVTGSQSNGSDRWLAGSVENPQRGAWSAHHTGLVCGVVLATERPPFKQSAASQRRHPAAKHYDEKASNNSGK